MTFLTGLLVSSLLGAISIPQDGGANEKEKIEALIAHVAKLEEAVFIRNGGEYSPADAAAHMRRKWEYAGSQVQTAREFIEHIASKSSMSGEPYLIRFSDGREVQSGPYLTAFLNERERAREREDPSAPQDRAMQPAPAAQAMKPFDAFMGEWEGTLGGEGPDGSPTTIAINWTTTRVFNGRWIRFEFTSKEPAPTRRYLEWEGLFTAHPETGEVETVWMTPRLRAFADAKFLDGRMIFFEKGRWDESGRVLTLIAQKQYGPDQPVIEVKSTFTIAEDGQSFTVVDEEKQADGSWKTSGTFTLRRVEKSAPSSGNSLSAGSDSMYIAGVDPD